MATNATFEAVTATSRLSSRLYNAVWRWHFYAGLYVVPFLLMLAITGLIMLWVNALDGREGERGFRVAPQATPLAVSALGEAARAAVPDGVLTQYLSPKAPDLAALFRVDRGEDAQMVAVDPFTGSVLGQWPRRAGWYDFAETIHGTLMLGTVGDGLIEIAAGFGIVLILTGLYLWWPRQGEGVASALLPNLGLRGRAWWKSLHRSMGFWIAAILLVFLLSGLSWTGVWGAKFVQAWSTFPAEKWDNVPVSDETHAAMNHGGIKEVPWALEQTPMPASGSPAGSAGIAAGVPVDLDGVAAFARAVGLSGRFQIALPKGEAGVWTISQDSMSGDGPDPTSDRTVHLDRYTGKVLADVRYADYTLGGKAMAVGVALHEGDLGWWNVAFNTTFCLAVIFLAVSGVVMWWRRRPAGAGRLVAPPRPSGLPMWQGVTAAALLVSIAFPLTGLALLAVLTVDMLVVQKVPRLRRAFA